MGKRQTLHLDEGQSVGVRGSVRVTDATATGDDRRTPLVFKGGTGRALQAYRGPLDLIVTPFDNYPPPQLCTVVQNQK